MTCVTLELKPQEKREVEYEQQKKSLIEDIHFNIIFKCIYIRRCYVIVSFMKKKFVDELHWIEEKEMLDLVAIVFTGSDPIKGTVRKRVCGDVKVLHTFFLCVEHI